MRILVVGGGGREHALCLALRQELPSADLYCAPGNPGTAELATNLNIAATDIDRLADAADAYGIELTVVGPEQPLAMGLADRLRAEGRPVFGPGAAAAQIEASKAYAKEIMQRAGVPTAASRTFTRLDEALAYVGTHPEPLVVKASGLAAGKGAVVCATRGEARQTLEAMLGEGRMGDAGRVVVVEEFMEGEELSVFAITDGASIQLLPSAQDHKRLGEGDTGPNTGGMGAYGPVAIATPALLERIEREVLLPTLRRAGPGRSAIQRCALRRNHGHPCRQPAGSGVQLPPGRSGDAGRAALGGRRIGGMPGDSGRRTAAYATGIARRLLRDHHGSRIARLPGRAGQGRRDHPAGAIA